MKLFKKKTKTIVNEELSKDEPGKDEPLERMQVTVNLSEQSKGRLVEEEWFSDILWLKDNQEWIKQFENTMVNSLIAGNKEKNLQAKLKMYQTAHQAYDDLKQRCEAQGSLGIRYISNMWESPKVEQGALWIDRLKANIAKTEKKIEKQTGGNK